MADPPQGMIPIPDPTTLTKEAVAEAKAEIMMLLEEKLNVIRANNAATIHRLEVAERQRLEQKADTTKALDAAFSAAKEEVAGVDSRVDDLKDRVTRIESTRAGLYAAAAIVAAVLGLIGFILANGNI